MTVTNPCQACSKLGKITIVVSPSGFLTRQALLPSNVTAKKGGGE